MVRSFHLTLTIAALLIAGISIAVLAQQSGCVGLSSVAVCENFSKGGTAGTVPAGKSSGEFTAEGWKVTDKNCQIVYDLGQFCTHAVVEFEIKGPLSVPNSTYSFTKQIAFAAWNEQAMTDGNRETQSFIQLRFQDGGMMLRLTNRSGGRSFEGKTGKLSWNETQWYTIKGEWDTQGGTCTLWRDGEVLKTGKFNAKFPGLRWCAIGRDNYKGSYQSLPGAVYRNLKIYGVKPGGVVSTIAISRPATPAVMSNQNRPHAAQAYTLDGRKLDRRGIVANLISGDACRAVYIITSDESTAKKQSIIVR